MPCNRPLDMFDGSSLSPDGVTEFFDHFFGGVVGLRSDAYHSIAFTFCPVLACKPPGFFR
jgi:hypothetical protein